MPLIFYLCFLQFSSVGFQNGHTETFAVRTVQECDQLERLKGAHTSGTLRFNGKLHDDMMRVEAQCGKPPNYPLCPVYKGDLD